MLEVLGCSFSFAVASGFASTLTTTTVAFVYPVNEQDGG